MSLSSFINTLFNNTNLFNNTIHTKYNFRNQFKPEYSLYKIGHGACAMPTMIHPIYQKMYLNRTI
jgi:hypothetical protein